MDLLEVFKGAMEDLVAEGYVQEAMRDNLKECVNKTVKNMFKWGGEGETAIVEAVKKSMKGLSSKIDIPDYTLYIASVVGDMYKDALTKQNISVVEEEIATQLKPLPSKMCTYDFWNVVKDRFRHNNGLYVPFDVDVVMSDDENAVYLTITSTDGDWENYKVVFYNNDNGWRIGYLEGHGKPLNNFLASASHETILGPMKYIFSHYANYTEFEMDIDSFDNIYAEEQ